MIKIRPNCFETNSSSMDRYDDYDMPDHGKADHYITIHLTWTDDITEERFDEIADKLSTDLVEKLAAAFSDYFEDSCNEVEVDDDTIHMTYKGVYVSVHYEGSYYPATRYEPEECPEEIMDDEQEFGVNDLQPSQFNAIKQQLMKVFKDAKIPEIIDVTKIEGEWDNFKVDY